MYKIHSTDLLLNNHYKKLYLEIASKFHNELQKSNTLNKIWNFKADIWNIIFLYNIFQ